MAIHTNNMKERKMKHLLLILRFCISFFLFGVAGFSMAAGKSSLTVGNMQVEMLIDETGEGDTSILLGATPEMLKQYIPQGKFPMAIASALIRSPEGVTLIDTGLGKKLTKHLEERQITPEKVETILITHMHFDHINGLMREGKVVFPNAKLYIAEPEVAYWKDSENIKKFPKEQQEAAAGYFKDSQAVLNAYQDRIVTFSPGEVTKGGSLLLPGVKTMAAYGHTPGHTAFLLQNEDKKLLVAGDLWHVGLIQFAEPSVTVVYDVDPKLAAQSRSQIFAYAVANKIPMAGMHQSNPEIGLLKAQPKKKAGYVFEPLP